MKSATLAINEVTEHARTVKDGKHETVKPGQPFSFNESHTVGDGVWQGDLGIRIVDSIPKGYVKVAKPTKTDTKLVPGPEDGAKHHLDSLDGVMLYRPEGWGTDTNALLGPCFTVSKPRKIVHSGSGQHGTVNLIPGQIYATGYQRVWEHEQARERRALD